MMKHFLQPNQKKHENPLEQSTKLTLEAWLTQDPFCICCFFIIIIIIIIPCSVVASLREHTHTHTQTQLEGWKHSTTWKCYGLNHWLPLRPFFSGGMVGGGGVG